MSLKEEDFMGYSDSSMEEAIANALKKAGENRKLQAVETSSTQGEKECSFAVTLVDSEDVEK